VEVVSRINLINTLYVICEQVSVLSCLEVVLWFCFVILFLMVALGIWFLFDLTFFPFRSHKECLFDPTLPFV